MNCAVFLWKRQDRIVLVKIDGPEIKPAIVPFSGAKALHALIDTVPDAMIVIDESGRIMSFSKGAAAMFGYAEADVLGENVSLLMPSPDRERHDGYMAHYRETGERKIIGIGRVTTARHRDGTTFPVDLSVGEFHLGTQRVFAGFIRDLTETRETERKLHSLQAELAHVSRITSMGTLATSIAHELNQPLTAVVNYAQSARDLLNHPGTNDLATVREALDECSKEALRAGQIVQRLRAFISRGDAIKEVYSLQLLIKEATALALMNGDARGVDFATFIDFEHDLVLVDRVQIQQVLVNLIRNALEAMEDLDAKRLVIRSSAGKAGTVRVSVSDSGLGLDPGIAEKLFHPFMSTKPSGIGLGLSICHTIVNAHGGRIWVEPSEFGGTTFNFTLIEAKLEEKDA
jgi:two-component system sensor kinase FixL